MKNISSFFVFLEMGSIQQTKMRRGRERRKGRRGLQGQIEKECQKTGKEKGRKQRKDGKERGEAKKREGFRRKARQMN